MGKASQTMRQQEQMNSHQAKLPEQRNIRSLINWPFLALITMYRYTLSPLIGQNCRFHPTCSCYAHQAIDQLGLFKGIVLTIKRILKCHPLHPGGFDPVPGCSTDDSSQK